VGDDDERLYRRTCAFPTDDQLRRPNRLNRATVQQCSNKGDKEGGPSDGEQAVDGYAQIFVHRGYAHDGDAYGGLDGRESVDIDQDPDNVVLHRFACLPGVEIFGQSSQAGVDAIYRESSCGSVGDLDSRLSSWLRRIDFRIRMSTEIAYSTEDDEGIIYSENPRYNSCVRLQRDCNKR
jgi:hypothetical protein